jgi:hypothetical protein
MDKIKKAKEITKIFYDTMMEIANSYRCYKDFPIVGLKLFEYSLYVIAAHARHRVDQLDKSEDDNFIMCGVDSNLGTKAGEPFLTSIGNSDELN